MIETLRKKGDVGIFGLHVTSALSATEFNDEVKRAIDETISTVLGEQVLKALYEHLKKQYDVTSDEIPYRLDTFSKTLEDTFGVKGALTLSRVIARRVYARIDLQFVELGNYNLQDYLQDAKIDLALSSRMKPIKPW